MTIAGNALCLEFWRLSRARVRGFFPLADHLLTSPSAQWSYKRGYPAVPPTFRSPTPIIVFQSVLIPGAFLSGFLLSPLLVISRHIASKPSHRLKVRIPYYLPRCPLLSHKLSNSGPPNANVIVVSSPPASSSVSSVSSSSC
jgi:hypothetical protein